MVSATEGAVLFYEGPTPPKRITSWLVRALRWSGILSREEPPASLSHLSSTARKRLSRDGEVRAEFRPGAGARLRGLLIREAADYADIRSLLAPTGRRA